MSEFRDRIYSTYYSEHFQENRLNKPDSALFERASLGYEWNYGNYIKQIKKGSKVLDIGCGIGQGLYWLNKRGLKAVGIDRSSEQLEQARIVLDDIVELNHADAFEYLDSHIKTFSVVLANDLIEHFTRPEALKFSYSIYESLVPGGIVVIKAPNAICPSAGNFFNDLTHERPYTERSIRRLLRTAGFINVKVFSFEHPPFRSIPSMLAWGIRRLTWSLYRVRLFLHDFSPGTKVVGKHLCAVAKKP
jgi:2-polyprenyl-3-methyl-5-hydroxy-6-metoxy-1,4-benzoquinol methylase